MNVLLSGCCGRMGTVVSRLLSESSDMAIVAGVDRKKDSADGPYPVYEDFTDIKEDIDVIIDFSHRSCLDALLDYAESAGKPLVIGTTGLEARDMERISKAAGHIPVLQSYNMSLGINLLLSLAKQAALLLEQNQFDIEIVERHHNQKKDAPSGTAILIAETINSVLGNRMELTYGRHGGSIMRRPSEIGIHAIRGGAIVGEHDVIFAGQGETIEIKHSALSREVFACGAIAAARFVTGKENGKYTMADVVARA